MSTIVNLPAPKDLGYHRQQNNISKVDFITRLRNK